MTENNARIVSPFVRIVGTSCVARMGDTLRQIWDWRNGCGSAAHCPQAVARFVAVRQHPAMPRDFLQPSADPLLLYHFRFRDPVSGKWVRARYKAQRTEIATRYAEWELCGPAEIRARGAAGFSPWRSGS